MAVGAEAQAAFEELQSEFEAEPNVALPVPGAPRQFGSTGLRVEGKIFVFQFTTGALVAKLPKERVAEVIAQGFGQPFRSGNSRVMGGWVSVDAAHSHLWSGLAWEALQYVRIGS